MLDIRWRPSGGRGEYEYKKVSNHDVLHKKLIVRVPVLGIDIPTDASCEFMDGKPRLRRADANDRTKLNVPPLVAAIAGLPEPRREDTGAPPLPLASKGYVVDSIQFDIVKETPQELIVEPRLLRPRHAEYLDLDDRIQQLVSAEATNPAVHKLLTAVRSGRNERSALAKAAEEVHEILPAVITGLPVPAAAGPSEEETDEIVAEYSGKEGKVRIREHRHIERDRKLVARAKQRFKKRFGMLFCECCGIDFRKFYSDIGVDFIEAHHLIPLGELAEEKTTSIDDLAMLCANCHRMVHRTKSCSVEEVKAIIAKNNTYISAANVRKLIAK